MPAPEPPRAYVPPENTPVSPIEYALLSKRVDDLDGEKGDVTVLKADMGLMKDRWARVGGAFWTLLVINGIFAFIATLASIYVAFKK